MEIQLVQGRASRQVSFWLDAISVARCQWLTTRHKPYTVHVIPIGHPPDMEHEPGTAVDQHHGDDSCALCQEGICWQSVEQVDRYDGTVGLVVVHGTLTQ